MRITKSDIVYMLARKRGISKREAADILNDVLYILAKEMIKFNEIELRGFGVFKPVIRKGKKKDYRARAKFMMSSILRAEMERNMREMWKLGWRPGTRK